MSIAPIGKSALRTQSWTLAIQAFCAAVLAVGALLLPATAHAAPAETLAEAGTAVDAPAVATVEDDALPFKLSLPTEEDRVAWQRPGFRMALGLEYGTLRGLDGAPSGRIFGAILRTGARLDTDWSLLLSFHYASASATGGLAALRFAGTLDPTWHVNEHLELAAGVGFGGLVESSTGRADPYAAQRQTLDVSITYPKASPPVSTCSGLGPAGLLRAGWMQLIGPLASTGIVLEVQGQWTGCVVSVGRTEADTAKALVQRQWWPLAGATLAWMVQWR